MKISRAHFDAVIFDLDGVITQSARVHAQAWKEMFDRFLAGRHQPPFDLKKDYLTFVDGKPRLDGIRSFLTSRGIEIDEKRVRQLGEEKNAIFLKYLRVSGIDVYEESVAWARALRDRGFRLAIISSSKNCAEILERAGVADLFEVRVDGVRSEELGLQGKPSPEIFLQAARELGVEPARAVVVEDALAGVEAAKAGGFGYVIAMNRGDQEKELKEAGADLVLSGDVAWTF